MQWTLIIWLCAAMVSQAEMIQGPSSTVTQDDPTINGTHKLVTLVPTIEEDLNNMIQNETGDTSQLNTNATKSTNEEETATKVWQRHTSTITEATTQIRVSSKDSTSEEIDENGNSSSKEDSTQDKREINENGPPNIENGSGNEPDIVTETMSTQASSTSPEPDDEEYSDEPIDSGLVDRSAETTDIITTEGGQVKGFLLHNELGIRSYLDIPYGQFSHPFKAPKKATPWNTVREVREHDKRCSQLDATGGYTGTLDCLTLSVFVPPNAMNLSVLFHIYDGQFTTGSADPSIYGPEYLASKKVILVLPNYRLGPLGFLSLQNELAPGNAALKDLALALKWTKNNIAEFGGNPLNIVVSGDGMAGALAGYLALSPKSRDDISGVIAESGSVLAHWAIDRNPLITSAEVTDFIKEEMTETEVANLLIATKHLTFRPCTENSTDAFINKTPWKILHDDVKIEIPFMVGSANHAGMHDAVKETTENLLQLDRNFSRFLPNDLEFDNYENKIEVGEKVRKAYFTNKSINIDTLDDIILCYTDAYYMSPAIRVARALIDAGAKVYFYEFSFVGAFNRELLSMSPKNPKGAARGDIVGYTFTQDKELPQKDSEEERVVNIVTDLWITFINTGKPSVEGVTWNQLLKSVALEEEWLSIALKAEPQKGLHVNRLELWTEIYRDHFVERNLATQLTSGLHVLIIAALLLLGFKLTQIMQ